MKSFFKPITQQLPDDTVRNIVGFLKDELRDDVLEMSHIPGRQAEHNAKLDLLTTYGIEPEDKELVRDLQKCIKADHKTLFDTLLNQADERHNLTPAFETSAFQGNSQAFKALLNKASTLGTLQKYANDANLLEWLAICGQTESLQNLLDLSTQVEDTQKEKLLKSSQEEQPHFQELNSQTPSAQVKDYHRQLRWAVLNSQPRQEHTIQDIRTILAIIRAGIPVDTMETLDDLSLDDDDDDPVWPLLHHTNSSPDLNKVKAFIHAGVNVNCVDKKGLTVLHRHHSNPDIMNCLIQAGAKVDAVDRKGQTPLHIAAKFYYSNPDIMNCLIQAGAKVDAVDRKGQTPLHIAAKHAELNNINTLIKAGANASAVNHNGETPLHLVITGGKNTGIQNPQADLAVLTEDAAACVSALVQAGADVNAVNHNGETPLSLAIRNGHNALAKILRDHGAKG